MLLVLWLACAEPPEPQPSAPPTPPVAGDGAQRGSHLALRTDMLVALRESLGAAYDAPPAGLDKADPAAGEAVYKAHCLGCHGDSGRGGPDAQQLDPRPTDLSHPGKASFFSDAARLEIIRKGFTGSAMQGYAVGQGAGVDLSEAQILDVYAYVLSLKRAAQPGREVRERPEDVPR